MQEGFRKLAAIVSNAMGSPIAFIFALIVIITWAVTGPLFNFSNTWQLFINTGTTIATFLMVFLIQNTQNRDGRAVHLKLDELIKAVKGARNSMVDIENLSDNELDELQSEFKKVHDKAQAEIERIQKVKSEKKR